MATTEQFRVFCITNYLTAHAQEGFKIRYYRKPERSAIGTSTLLLASFGVT